MDLDPAGRFEWERLIRRVQIEPSEKHIALTMATYADADGTRIRPGTERLVRVTGLSKSTVIRALTKLRGYGLIERTGERFRNGRRGGTDEYRLTRPRDLLAHIPMLDPDEEPVSPMTPVRLHVIHNQVSPMTLVPDPDDGGTSVTRALERVSYEPGTGVTHDTPPEQDQPIDQPHPQAQVADSNVEGAKLSTGDPANHDHWAGPVERAAAHAIQEHHLWINAASTS